MAAIPTCRLYTCIPTDIGSRIDSPANSTTSHEKRFQPQTSFRPATISVLLTYPAQKSTCYLHARDNHWLRTMRDETASRKWQRAPTGVENEEFFRILSWLCFHKRIFLPIGTRRIARNERAWTSERVGSVTGWSVGRSATCYFEPAHTAQSGRRLFRWSCSR